MTFLKMRHFAIIGAVIVTSVAMVQGIDFAQLVPFYGFLSAIIIGDKVIDERKE